MYDILQLNEMLVPELKSLAEKLEVPGYKKLAKQDLIYKILDHQAVSSSPSDKKEAKEDEKVVKVRTVRKKKLLLLSLIQKTLKDQSLEEKRNQQLKKKLRRQLLPQKLKLRKKKWMQ